MAAGGRRGVLLGAMFASAAAQAGGGGCTDSAASNYNPSASLARPTECKYDCEQLKARLGPHTYKDCYLFDPRKGIWVSTGHMIYPTTEGGGHGGFDKQATPWYNFGELASGWIVQGRQLDPEKLTPAYHAAGNRQWRPPDCPDGNPAACCRENGFSQISLVTPCLGENHDFCCGDDVASAVGAYDGHYYCSPEPEKRARDSKYGVLRQHPRE